MVFGGKPLRSAVIRSRSNVSQDSAPSVSIDTLEGEDETLTLRTRDDHTRNSAFDDYTTGGETINNDDLYDVAADARGSDKKRRLMAFLGKRTVSKMPFVNFHRLSNGSFSDKDVEDDDFEHKEDGVPELRNKACIKRYIVPISVFVAVFFIFLGILLLRPGGRLSGGPDKSLSPSTSPAPTVTTSPTSTPAPSFRFKAVTLTYRPTTPKNDDDGFFNFWSPAPTKQKDIKPSTNTTSSPSPPIFSTNIPTPNPSQTKSSPETAAPTLMPSSKPNINQPSRYIEIRDHLQFLAEDDFALSMAFDDPNSPQSQSLDWIAMSDPKQLQIDLDDMTASFALFRRWIVALLWFSMGGPEWRTKNRWLGNSHECDWYGIECNSDLRVIGIILNNNKLIGSIPTEIGIFRSLEKLNLRRNMIQGTLPTEIGNIINLEALLLMSNSIEGKIPTTIGKLKNLEYIGLGINSLVGPIPSEIGNLENLVHIELWSNNLEGIIPDTFSKLVKLQHFYVDGNFLVGTVPTYFGSFPLEVLSLGDNAFSGSIPPSIFNLTNLKSLWLNKNMLDGTIPSELFELSNIENLYLEDNFFDGTIPDRFADLVHLGDLRLYGNKLSGCIPNSLFELPSLELIYLDDNKFSCRIPENVFKSKSIIDLRMSSNELSGTLPEIEISSSPLEVFMVADNDLSGTIPASIGNLAALESLALSHNMLRGKIPTQLAGLLKLVKVDLEGNQFNGAVPGEFGIVISLREMRLEDNMLTGIVPSSLCDINLDYLSSDCDRAVIECECCNNCPKR